MADDELSEAAAPTTRANAFALRDGVAKQVHKTRIRHAMDLEIRRQRVNSDTKPKAKTTREVKSLSLERALEMAATLAEDLYRDLRKPDADLPPAARKHLQVAWAVTMDKWTILTGRPTQIHSFTAAEETRDGLKRLGELIATKGKDRVA